MVRSLFDCNHSIEGQTSETTTAPRYAETSQRSKAVIPRALFNVSQSCSFQRASSLPACTASSASATDNAGFADGFLERQRGSEAVRQRRNRPSGAAAAAGTDQAELRRISAHTDHLAAVLSFSNTSHALFAGCALTA